MADPIHGRREEESTAVGPTGRAGAVVQDIEAETIDGSLVDPDATAGTDGAIPGPQDSGALGNMGGGSSEEQDRTGYTDGRGRYGTGTGQD
jgi:hypothetical protein